MAKKSAKSKGYRKAVEKKPYLSRRDIVILCCMLVAVAIAAILLFRYDDGGLKVKDGRIVDAQDNWLIVNGSATGGTRYYKLAEAGEMAGYTMETEASIGDENLRVVKYAPEGEGEDLSVRISCTAAKPDRSAEYYHTMFSAFDPTEIAQANDGGAEYSWFSYRSSYYTEDGDAAEAEPSETAEADESEHAPNRFEQGLNAYYPAPRDYTINISVQAKADSEDAYLPDEQLLDIASKAYAALTLEAE